MHCINTHTFPSQIHTFKYTHTHNHVSVSLSSHGTWGRVRGEGRELQQDEEEAEVNSQCCLHIHQEMSGSCYRGTVRLHVVTAEWNMYDMYEKVVNRGEATQGVEDGIERSKWAGVSSCGCLWTGQGRARTKKQKHQGFYIWSKS